MTSHFDLIQETHHLTVIAAEIGRVRAREHLSSNFLEGTERIAELGLSPRNAGL
jgi:hypothetical protein